MALKIDISKLIQRPIRGTTSAIIGNKYGRIFVIEYAGDYLTPFSGTVQYVWTRCDCGKVSIQPAEGIKYGHTKSCGCIMAEKSRQRMTKHGESGKTKAYNAWANIRVRCFGNKSENSRYKELGITMCIGWAGVNGFLNFKKDIGEPPSIKHSIDRIDFNGHYSCGHCDECKRNKWPMNCRWATSEIQNNNTSKNRYVFINGEKLSYRQAERKLGFNHGIIWSRLSRGWSIDDAVSVEPILGNKIYKHQ